MKEKFDADEMQAEESKDPKLKKRYQ